MMGDFSTTTRVKILRGEKIKLRGQVSPVLVLTAEVLSSRAVLLFRVTDEPYNSSFASLHELYSSGREGGTQADLHIGKSLSEHHKTVNTNEYYAPMPCRVKGVHTKVEEGGETSMAVGADADITPRHAKRRRPL